ncbi:MAG: EamA family transporter [Opitutales bacterium]
MSIPGYYILPLLAGLGYALSAVCSKRAMVEGAGMMRLIVATNWATVLAFSALLLFLPSKVDWSHWLYPLLAGVSFFVGQGFTFLAIRVGDVSIQGPMMGTKTVFVALVIAVFGTVGVDTVTWIGAFLTAVAVFLLGFSGWGNPRQTLWAIVLALAASASFAAADVQMATNAPKFGPAPFLVVMGLTNALLSMGFVPFFKGRFRELPRRSLPWFWAGAGLMGLQALIICGSLSSFGQETTVTQNILYSARGFWSILLVSVLGGLFGNLEQGLGPRVVAQRLVGTSLLLVAIVLVLTR